MKFTRPMSGRSNQSKRSNESGKSYMSAAFEAEVNEIRKEKNDLKRRVKKN